MQNPEKLLFAAALGLAAIGTGVAIVQPGDLGGQETAAPTTTTSTSSTSTVATTTVPTVEVPTTTVSSEPSTGEPSTGEPSTGEPSTGEPSTDTTTGSATSGSSGTDDPELPNSGGTSLLGAAMVAGAAGLVVRRRSS